MHFSVSRAFMFHNEQPVSNEAPQSVKVTLRLTVIQSVSLGVEPCLGLMTRYQMFDNYCPVHVVRPLCGEDGSVVRQSHSQQ
jgi:hypothetical protein